MVTTYQNVVNRGMVEAPGSTEVAPYGAAHEFTSSDGGENGGCSVW